MAKAFEMKNPGALTAQLDALDVTVSESTLRKAALAGANIFLAEEKLRIPRDSGKGAASLVIAYDAENSVTGKIASYVVTWLKDAYYLRFVEYGTSKMAAKPFKRPAYEAKKKAAAQAVADAIDSEIKAKTSGK
ncbi:MULTISPECIES: HK97-gp10 family putative phage morphogenesis protein [unclassified Caballeronia]|uniref:HK97-gp10 family putative phage morphogenesis protein n=1 Tax=unclassified Caballeronia TaxID=2646786 RepID=UPI002860BD2E|nr:MULTISPECIES: HK97-gp10 family putative phage morphogenesis protein [unclassified Caballeronia]MDR5774912.1 HK97 gp10 family phage protein [Caballeronia sp. LZ002]MDR5850348.1 HK97 gp10 family phage protein [Caballeronia sp. LZ003]